MNDSKDFQDAQSVRSGNSHVTSPPGLFPRHPPFQGMLKPAFISQRQTEEPPDIWDAPGISGNVFCKSTSFLFRSVSSRIKFYLEENYWRTNSHVYSGEEWKTRTKSRSEMPVWTVSQRFSHLQWRRFKELFGRPTTTADFGSSFRQIPYTSQVCLLEDKIQDWGMYLLTISYGSDAMDQWSGDGWFSGWFKVFVINKRHFNAKFWSTWCEDCPSTKQNQPYFRFQKKNQSGGTAQKQDRFFRGRQIAYLIYDYFRVTETNDSVENCADLFTIGLRNDNIQEFGSKWDGILLSMTKIPPDDILEGLYKLRIRESEKLKTVLELYDLETHQKRLGPDYHRLKAMVKRSIEQEIRNENFGARSGNFEKNAVVKNQGTKQRVQRILGDCL